MRLPEEQAAWERFVQLYTPPLHRMSQRLGVPEADEADLLQEVFAVLVRALPEFKYDPRSRFRGWLWTVLANKWRELRRRRSLNIDGDPGLLADIAVEDPQSAEEEAGNCFSVLVFLSAFSAFSAATLSSSQTLAGLMSRCTSPVA